MSIKRVDPIMYPRPFGKFRGDSLSAVCMARATRHPSGTFAFSDEDIAVQIERWLVDAYLSGFLAGARLAAAASA